jgi:2-C-methyl-D-erythritol 4-phosphate cytidylyltransferase
MLNASPLWCVVPAAGFGTRLDPQTPKQHRKLGQQSVLGRVLECLAAHPAVDGIALGLAAHDPHIAELLVGQNTFAGKPLLRYTGGATRAETVLRGLLQLSERIPDHSVIAVHDAARPLLPLAAFQRVLSAYENGGCGAILALPVADTLKLGDRGFALHSVPRERLYQAQTPQVFSLGALRSALSQAIHFGHKVTDEASAMEHAGHKVQLVEGDALNFKLTTAADLAFAERLVAAGIG